MTTNPPSSSSQAAPPAAAARALPEIVHDAAALRSRVSEARRAGKRIGLVPTMGALHAGHASLVDASVRDDLFTVVTIFVNPTQFGPNEDFARYPRTLAADAELLAAHGADLIFAPSTDTMYPAGHVTSVELHGPALVLEGEHRPGHFRGVATIVLKLFNLVQPDCAYFGHKDYQQALLVRRMTRDLDLPICVVVCPTVREPDGLALSSRNAYLSADERLRALAIWRSLQRAAALLDDGTTDAGVIVAEMGAVLDAAGLQVDYVALVDPETLAPVETIAQPTLALIAARAGATRLIDNALLTPGH